MLTDVLDNIFVDKLEFLNRMKSKYDWYNDDTVDNEDGLIDPEPTHTRHHGIQAEIQWVDLESDEADESENKNENTIVPAVLVLPDWSDRANAARENANIIYTTRVVDEQIPGANMYHEVDTDGEDKINSWRHAKDDNKADWRIIYEIVEESVEASNNELPPESQQYGRGQRVRTQRTMYVPGSAEFTGHNNQLLGVLNLQYRGQKYHLREGVVSLNMNNENPGVADYESQPSQYSDGVINLNLSNTTYDWQKNCEKEVEEHILGLIMAHKYIMKKGIELLGEKGE